MELWLKRIGIFLCLMFIYWIVTTTHSFKCDPITAIVVALISAAMIGPFGKVERPTAGDPPEQSSSSDSDKSD